MSDENSGSTTYVEPELCFHCGLPNNGDTSIPQYKVQNQQRDFCCHGCYVVCKTIIESGLDDFYQFRTTTSGHAEADLVPDILSKLQIYDRPELQKSFVHSSDEWQEASLMLEDIRCPACLWLNEHHLRQQKGVLEVSIDAATQRMRLRWDSNKTQLSLLLKTIADIGYIAHPYDAKHTQNLIKTRKTRSIERLIFSGFLGMMVMNFSIATYLLIPEFPFSEQPLWVTIGGWTSLFVCTTLLAYPAQDFWFGAWRDLKNKRLGMDLPIVFGLFAAYLGSLNSLVTGKGDVYFDSIAMFIFFVLLARYFEVAGKLNAASYIDQLGRATPQTATKLEAEQLVEVPVFDLKKDDVIRILPGETIAADGVIIKGVSTVDESLLTGESEPVLKGLGDTVIAGSVNGEQLIHSKVNVVGRDTVLGTIKHLVDSGLEKKPDVVLLADKAARIFVPIILALAFLTAVVWYFIDPSVWLSNTIAVLIVTCPCALALATPVALSVTAGRFVKMGVLPINMSALESFALANVVALDKTGTLTNGHPHLVDIELINVTTKDEVLQLAKSLASNSEHPLAKAIGDAQINVDTLLDVSELKNKPGFGLSGVMDNQHYYLGNASFVLEHTSTNNHDLSEIKRIQNQGFSISILANDKKILCVFCFTDELREGAKKLLIDLQQSLNVETAILSGDTQQNVDVVAKELGINQVFGGLRPEQKLNWVRQSQAQGNKVLMFGDGINDAPTLAAADVSVSIAGATDLAHLSSDFVLLKTDITVLVKAKRLAALCRKNIKQNMFWAVGYNIIAVPLAILGYVPPWLAAIGMSASSLIVVLNSLRLNKN